MLLRRNVLLAVANALAIASAGEVRAEPPQPSCPNLGPVTLRYDSTVDITVTAVGGALWIGSEIMKPSLASGTCRWCSENSFDSSVRDGLKWSNTAAADTSSTLIGLGLAPLALIGADALLASSADRLREFPVDALVILEAAVLAQDLNQAVKFAVARERPFVHALPESEKGGTAQPSDNNMSFFSGHTSLAFSLATSAGTIAELRGYSYTPLVWASGMTLAATTGYLRIAADHHYATDVIVGAVVGAAIGFGVPYFFHRPVTSTGVAVLSPMPLPGGGGLSYGGSW